MVTLMANCGQKRHKSLLTSVIFADMTAKRLDDCFPGIVESTDDLSKRAGKARNAKKPWRVQEFAALIHKI